MKKIYALLLVAAGTILSAASQPFEKGDKLLGGSVGFSLSRSTTNYNQSPNSSDSRYYSFGVSPSLGFFTKPNRLSGFSLQFNYASNVPSSIDNKQKNYTYGASFYKQYWNSLGKNFHFIIQGKVGGYYNNSKYIYSIQNEEFRGGAAYLSIDPGFAYRIKNRLVLDVYYTNFLYSSFGYTDSRRSDILVARNYVVSASTGLQSFSANSIVFGFRYLL